jgi:GR25 family glycosyltransferase involved in LPS biosynthesis
LLAQDFQIYGVKELNFKYVIVGIRPRGNVLLKELSEIYKKDAVLISYNGFTNPSTKFIYDLRTSSKIMRREMTLGEIGCAYGHLLAYKNALTADWLIVLEDDTYLNGDINKIENILRKMNNRPTVIHLDDQDLSHPNTQFYTYPFSKRPYRTHAYAINAAAIAVAVKTQKMIISTADWPIQWRYSVLFLSLKNDVFCLNEEGSTLEIERLPLQALAVQDFQNFRTNSQIRKLINCFSGGKSILGFFYMCHRISIYLRNLDLKLFIRIKVSVLSAMGDIN